ncbi:MAG TPA: hypothetical protein VF897_06785, partial [Roseiflexaceae bacterium]
GFTLWLNNDILSLHLGRLYKDVVENRTMQRSFQESLWLPAAVLVVGILLILGLLAAANRASTASFAVSAYPLPSSPCLFLPIVKNNFTSAELSAETAARGLMTAPTAYPPPTSPC